MNNDLAWAELARLRTPTTATPGKENMTDDQIKYMVNRFLGWRLPKPWHPDNGISYQRPNFAHAPAEHDWPTGTNLFDAQQATEMVRYMLEGLRTSTGDERKVGDPCVNPAGIAGTWQYNPDGWVCVVEPASKGAPTGDAMEEAEDIWRTLVNLGVTVSYYIAGAPDDRQPDAKAQQIIAAALTAAEARGAQAEQESPKLTPMPPDVQHYIDGYEAGIRQGVEMAAQPLEAMAAMIERDIAKGAHPKPADGSIAAQIYRHAVEAIRALLPPTSEGGDA